MTGPDPDIEIGKLERGERAGRHPARGERPAEDAHAAPVAPGHVLDLPFAASSEETEAGHRIREPREDLNVVVSAHREHRDTSRGKAIDSTPEIAVCFEEVVLLLDDVAREQDRVDFRVEGEVDGARPRRGRPELVRPQRVQNALRQTRGLPAEMDVTDAEKLHDFARSCAGQAPRILERTGSLQLSQVCNAVC